jgi:hypothetical protein
VTGKILAKINLAPLILRRAALSLWYFFIFAAIRRDYCPNGQKTGLPGLNRLIPAITGGMEVWSQILIVFLIDRFFYPEPLEKYPYPPLGQIG